MWYSELFENLEKLKDSDKASKLMNKYPEFNFIGVTMSDLSKFLDHYFRLIKNSEIDWEFINTCYKKEYREGKYIAVRYLCYCSNNLIDLDFKKIEKFIIIEPEYDIVLRYAECIGVILSRFPNLKSEILMWGIDDNIWLKIVALNYQNKYKDKTDNFLLAEIIKNSWQTKDIKLNRGIGLALRKYSKTNRKWVEDFLDKYKYRLNKKAISEARKDFWRAKYE